jgi:flagellar biogenesis protein FliO
MESAWRLIWALPLVLLVGAVAILVIRRIAPRPRESSIARLRLCESLQVSLETQLHLVEVDRRVHLVIESTRPIVQHWPDAPTAVASAPAQSWLMRLRQGRSP